MADHFIILFLPIINFLFVQQRYLLIVPNFQILRINFFLTLNPFSKKIGQFYCNLKVDNVLSSKVYKRFGRKFSPLSLPSPLQAFPFNKLFPDRFFIVLYRCRDGVKRNTEVSMQLLTLSK